MLIFLHLMSSCQKHLLIRVTCSSITRLRGPPRKALRVAEPSPGRLTAKLAASSALPRGGPGSGCEVRRM